MMGIEDTPKAKKLSRRSNSRLKQERERRGWSQSDIAERIGTTQINVSRWENSITLPGPYYRQKLAEIYGKSIQELGLIPEINTEKDENVTLPVGTSDTPTANPSLPIWNVPFRRNPFFTGREKILDHLYKALRSSNTAALTQAQAISGLGGIGKTQIAIEYGYRYRDHYQAIFWVNAAAHDTISADFATIALLLGLSTQQEQDIVVRSVKQWLSVQAGWLLILDNVDNLDMVADFLPAHSNGDVLLTTRLQALGTIAQSIEVEKMEMDEGITLLLRRAKVIPPVATFEQATEESKNQADLIFSELDGLPLALDQAGAYIEETHCGLAQYLNLYGTNRKELLLRRGKSPINHPQPVANTWSLSFQQVEQENFAAGDLLRLCAFLDPEAIPEEIITQGVAEAGPALEKVAGNPLEINTIIELLLRYSLIRRNPEERFLSVHRLVQAILIDDMDAATQRVWAERAIRAINRAFPDVDMKTWNTCQRLLPHVLACATHHEKYHLTFPEAGRLFHEAASYLVARGRYQQAEYLFLKALHIRQQISGETHPDVAQTLHHLANVYRAKGDYRNAESRYLQALSIREASTAIDPVLLAESFYGLAKLYNSQEKYQQAEKYCLQALDIREKYLGNNDPVIPSTLNLLAKIYQGQDKFVQAKETNLLALHLRESISGVDHPNVATILNSLVEIYHAGGNYREAEPLIIRAISIHEQSLGPNHPYMAYSLSNLAENYLLRGDYVQAESYYEEALAIREQSLGPNHPLIATSYHHFARLYVAMERYKEAEMFYLKSLEIRKQVFEMDHPIVIRTLAQYAILLKKLHKESEACKIEPRTGEMP